MTHDPTDELRSILRELSTILPRMREDEKRANVLKARTRELFAKHPELFVEKLKAKSARVFVDGPDALQVTPSEPSMTLVPEKLRDRLNDDALFISVLAEVKSAELDVPAWNRAMEDERVTAEDLLGCVDERTSSPAVTVVKA